MRSEETGRWFDRQLPGEVIEIAVFGPGVAVADDVEAVTGAGDGDVEDVGAGGDPVAGFFIAGGGAEDEDDDIGFFSLEGVDGTAFYEGCLIAPATEIGDGSEGGDDEYGVGVAG